MASKYVTWQMLNAMREEDRRNLKEEVLQVAIAKYLKEFYPGVIFKCDTSAVKMPVGQAKKMKRMGNTKDWPDLFIAEPRGIWHGCFIEIKRDGEKIHNKNGDYVNEHIEAQEKMLDRLYDKCYYATFALGWNDLFSIVNYYLKIGASA